jgi:hypothetical protein
MADRRIFFGFLAIILVMMVAAVVLIIIPAMAESEFKPSPRVIKETKQVEPFLLTSSSVTGVLSHFDYPCLIVHFPVNEAEAANLDAGIRKSAEAKQWDVIEAGPGYWRLSRVTEEKVGQRDTQGSEELRIRLEKNRGRVVLAWFRAENTSLPLGQSKAAEYVKESFWPSFENPDAVNL